MNQYHADVPKPGPRFLIPLAAAMFGANGAFMSSGVLTLSLKAAAIDNANATTILSIVVAIGAVFTLIAYPLIGRLSDLTHSRLGRRRPWILFGVVFQIIGTILQVMATNTAVLTLSYVVLVIGVVAVLVAAQAMVPDQIAPQSQASASTIIGLATAVGTALGLFLSQLMPNLTWMILLPAIVAVLGSLSLALLVPDPLPATQSGDSFQFVDFVRAFYFNPRQNPSFALVWLHRFLVFIGIAAVNAYQTFFLIRQLGIQPAQVGQKVFIAILVVTVVSAVTAPIAAKLAAHGNKKLWVIGASLVFALGLLLVVFSRDFNFFLLASAVMGLGQGPFFSVDFALAFDVLPDKANAARDLGQLNLANSLPQLVIAVVAPALLAIGVAAGTQNFAALFITGVVCIVAGVLALVPLQVGTVPAATGKNHGSAEGVAA